MMATLTTNSAAATTTTNVSFIVTGFGPFGTHVPENPTTRLAHQIKEYCQQKQITVATLKPYTTIIEEEEQQQEQQQHDAVSLASLITNTFVIETSAQAVRDQIDALYQQLCVNQDTDDTTTTTTSPKNTTIFLLHLGVHTKATCFHLEQCAYNDATFRIPDQQGFQPEQECIVAHVEHGVTFHTPCNVPSCVQQLENKANATTEHLESTTVDSDGQSETVKPSTDPGRFVCNYLYCYSLATFCSTNTHYRVDIATPNATEAIHKNHSHDSTKRNRQIYPLFVHVPPFTVKPEEEQLEFLAQLMKCLYQQVVRPQL